MVHVTVDGSNRVISFVGTFFHSTWRHSPEGRKVHINCCELLYSGINLPRDLYVS